MSALLALLLSLTLPPDATRVALDRDGWLAAAGGEGHATWWWSASCAPQKITSPDAVTCLPTRRLHVRTTAKASLLWATAAMLRDLPDDRLPSATANEEGLALIAAPAGEEIWIRVLAQRSSTPWTRTSASSGEVRLVPAPSVAFRIALATEDGEPPQRARVAVLPADCQRLCPDRFLAFADEEKPVSMFLSPGVAYRVTVWSDSHAPRTRTITAGDRDLALTLEAGGALRARLVDTEKKPLRGGVLEIQYRLPESVEIVRRTAYASGDGFVAVAGLPVSLIEWSAAAPSCSRRVDQARLEGGTTTTLGDITLHPAREARVVVLDDVGAAVASAKVIARGVSVASTDARGHAVLPDLPAGDVMLEIVADGFLPATATLRGNEREKVTVTLSRGAAVKATLIRESDGQTPVTARVRITNNGRQTLRTVDLSNGFRLSGLRAGTARFSIHTEGAQVHDTGTLQVIDGQVLDLGVITLAAGLEIRGTIVGEDAAPIAGARIRVLHADGDSPSLAHVLGNWSETQSAGDGTFRLAGLKPGSHLVVAGARGFAERVLPNVTVAENEPAFDAGSVALERGHTLELICRPGKRCGTEASLLPGGAEYPFLAIHTTLQNGRGTFDAVPSGDVTLRLTRTRHVLHEQNVTIAAGPRTSTLELELPAVRVHGEVVIGGRRAQQGSLLFTRSVRASGVPIMINGATQSGTTIDKQWLGSFGASASCELGSNGRYTLEDLEPGPYDVVFRSGGASTSSIRIDIPNVPDHHLTLQFAGAELAGRVVDAEHQPAAVRVEVIDAAGASHRTSSDRNGEFRLLGVSEGRARVMAAGGGKKADAEIDTDDASARNLLLRLADDGSAGLTVDVRDADGRPAAGVLVFALANSGVVAGSTDREGRVALPNVTGSVVPLAVHQPGGRWAFANGRSGESAHLVLPARPGSLVANSAAGAAVAAIVAPNGFPLDRVLPMVGISSRIASGSSLRVPGLPPGLYDVSVGMVRKGVTIAAGGLTEVRFGD